MQMCMFHKHFLTLKNVMVVEFVTSSAPQTRRNVEDVMLGHLGKLDPNLFHICEEQVSRALCTHNETEVLLLGGLECGTALWHTHNRELGQSSARVQSMPQGELKVLVISGKKY